MKKFVLVFTALVVILICADFSIAQIQTARIIVKGVSPDLMAQGKYDAVSSGLPNVGKGQKVWLEALALFTTGTVNNSWIDTIITEEWSLDYPPGGFTTIVHIDTTTYFIPYSAGQYQVHLTVTTSHGTKDTSVYINAGNWVGVGGIVNPPEVSKGECASCHGDKGSEWQGTNHATAFARKIDDAAGHFGSNCISCHSVGYDVLATAVNDGFDDIKTATGWGFPSPLQPGNWDAMKTNYPALAEKANIQCENCHGPGSEHYSMHDKNQIAASFSADVCGQCHGALSHHVKNYEWNSTAHAKSIGEPGEIEHMNAANCARCHTAQGFVYETIGGKPTAAPYADGQSVTCAACHDPHSEENPGQLRVSSIGDACTGCHINRISSRGLHHSPQGPMLAGVTGTPFTLGQTGVGTWGGLQFAGYQYRNSSHSDIADKCAECHMATIAGADTLLIPGIPYSQYRNKLGGHTFKVAYDNDTPDNVTDDILNPVGCKECHGTVSLEFVEQSQDKIHSLLDELSALLPHRTTGDTTQPLPHTDASLTTIQKAASYNWYFVSYDGSYGVHNFEYAAGLLRSSIEMVKLGAGAADIASIKDVPNDQGKQVQIVWNQFPAENDPVNPVINYLVLRQDSATAMAKSSSVEASSYTDMLTIASKGSRAIFAGSVWTLVGDYKALKLSKYSLNVPTLYDSTVFDGMKTATFQVVGYSATFVVYASTAASGYSVDNLAPAAPQGLTVNRLGPVVNLAWEAQTDADFKYFAVYRGIAPNFNPGGKPLATTVNNQYADASFEYNRTYYYKITAFDFSGNESNFTGEISITTGVDEQRGIPTEFALSQNHPNPFNPTTKIQYELPQATHVKISVYNTLGMLVTTLLDQEETAGYHWIEWNGKDNTGTSVASGIYLYKMEAGDRSFAKKMMFVK